MSRTITETRMLRYNFTPDEHLANSAEMARLYDNLSELEETHKSIKASLKEQEVAATSELSRIVRLVREKCDHRKTECRWIYDVPTVGQKTLRRNDTDADVETRRMEDFEKQESLNLVPVTEELPLMEVTVGVVPRQEGQGNMLEFERSGVALAAASQVAADVNAALDKPKAYPDAPADFHGSLEEWHAQCDTMDKIASDAKQPAMPETAKAEKRTPRFGK